MIATRLLISAMAIMGAVTFADQTSSEKASAAAKSAKRAAKKTGHRIEEAVCAEGDAKCAAKKLKHRAQEGSDYTEDKIDEAVDKAD